MVIARTFALTIFVLAAQAVEPRIGDPFELAAGGTVTIDGLKIAFDGVGEDSRCPTGAQCAWAGDAAADFTLERPPAVAEHPTLHTNGRFARQAGYQSFVVRLEDLKPYPKDGVAIAPGDYRATLVVTRR